ncbi:MAG: type II toxin-antitoxin system RelE/ParE family toxin [Dehalococcoidia bacterium]
MDVQFADDDLDRLETDPAFDMGLSSAIVKAYRRRMQGIRAAVDERDFYAMKSWHFEKLAGKRSHQRSIRLNDQYRLIVELVGRGQDTYVRIISVEDYH